MTLRPLAAERLTLNAAATGAELASVTDTSPITIWGSGSSSRIVPIPCVSTRIAFTGALRFTLKISFGSSRVSPWTAIVTGFDVSPGANVRVVSATAV